MRHHCRRPLTMLILLIVMMTVAASCGTSDETSDAAESAAGFSEDDDSGADDADGEDSGSAANGNVLAVDESDDTATDSADDADSPSADTAEPESADGDADLGAAGGSATPLTAADFGRKIIFTADITVEVDDVAAAGSEATDIISSVGGFVFGQQTQGGNQPESVLVFKVLPDDFDRAVEALGGVGQLRNQVISADDVTERVVDLETRIEVAELGVERLRATLEGTQNLEDYAELERLLLERESDLELMRGQLRTLQDRIDLATITLRLVQDAVNHSMLLNTSIYHAQDNGASCPGNDSSNVEAGTDITVCFEVVNSGEEPIADLVFIDTALGVDSADDLILVYGDLDRLEGGQSLMLAYEMKADRRTQLRPKVTGRPITADGESAGPSVDARGEGFIDAFEPEGNPGFGDGFGAGVDVLKTVWTAITVLVGFALPMLVLAAVFGPLVWFARRTLRRQRKETPSTQPPPPAGDPIGTASDSASKSATDSLTDSASD